MQPPDTAYAGQLNEGGWAVPSSHAESREGGRTDWLVAAGPMGNNCPLPLLWSSSKSSQLHMHWGSSST
jgi:hypothetical protein